MEGTGGPVDAAALVSDDDVQVDVGRGQRGVVLVELERGVGLGLTGDVGREAADRREPGHAQHLGDVDQLDVAHLNSTVEEVDAAVERDPPSGTSSVPSICG